jgi:hypothetical protein
MARISADIYRTVSIYIYELYDLDPDVWDRIKNRRLLKLIFFSLFVLKSFHEQTHVSY